MDNLKKLKAEVLLAKEKSEFKKTLASFAEKMTDIKNAIVGKDINLKKVEKQLAIIAKKEIKVVEKTIEFPKSIKIDNINETPVVKSVKVSNLKDIKLPEQPKEISIKQPKWFSFKGISDTLTEIKKEIQRKSEFSLDKYQQKKEALAVRLVTKDGSEFYNAGGGSSSAGLTAQEIAYLRNTSEKSSEFNTVIGANTSVKGLRVYVGPTDPIGDLPVFIDYDHHQLHEGETFRYGFYTASLGNGANKDIRIVVPNIALGGATAVQKCPHFRFEVISSVGGVVTITEATTFSANGTQRTPVALERNGTYVPKLQLWEDPTVNALGSQIYIGLLTASKQSAGAIMSSVNEFVLKNNTSYNLRFTSAGASNQVLIRFEWYEDLGV